VRDAPLVSCLIATYNYGEFIERAVVSALEQDYPPEKLEIVVIDDGSTDDTPERLERIMRAEPGRVRVVRQANTGATGATNRAIAEARGSLLAILDADDMWPPGKTRAQAELLQRSPRVGLAYTDMTVVDEYDEVVQPSFFDAFGVEPLEGSPLTSLLVRGNCATASSIMFRSSLRDVVHPVPPEIPYGDWWIAARVAQVADLSYLRSHKTIYRLHGGNLTLGVTGERETRERRKFTAFRRHFLRHLQARDLPPGEMLDLCDWVVESARWVSRSLRVDLDELLPVSFEERQTATALAARAREAARRGDSAEAASLYANALGHALDSEPAHEGMRELREAIALRT
jgi:glycosyltransferase involved in cell wall biosynthesis